MRLFLALFCLIGFKVRAAILMSGSSTVYPFAIVIADGFSYKTGLSAPIVESVGTGGGFAAFCKGNGVNSPDVVNASRPIKPTEKEECAKNGVMYKSVPIGLDAIVLAVHINTSSRNVIHSLTDEELFNAFARNVVRGDEVVPNPYRKWSEINPALPNTEITVYGPPSTSGTRDTFTEIVLRDYCEKIPLFQKKFGEKVKQACSLIRNDGRFIESGENDAFIVHKISLRDGAVGIFGYSHYMENHSKLHAVGINGIPPADYTISSMKYKIARPLFLYFKMSSLERGDVQKFYQEATSNDAIGIGGYLSEYHLIPLDKQFLAKHKLDEMDN